MSSVVLKYRRYFFYITNSNFETHWRHIAPDILVIIGSGSALGHCLNQCKLTYNWTIGNTSQRNLNTDAKFSATKLKMSSSKWRNMLTLVLVFVCVLVCYLRVGNVTCFLGCVDKNGKSSALLALREVKPPVFVSNTIIVHHTPSIEGEIRGIQHGVAHIQFYYCHYCALFNLMLHWVVSWWCLTVSTQKHPLFTGNNLTVMIFPW